MTNQIIIKHQRKTKQHCEHRSNWATRNDVTNIPFLPSFVRKYLHQILKKRKLNFHMIGNGQRAMCWLRVGGHWPHTPTHTHMCVSDVAADAFLKSLLIKFKTILHFGGHASLLLLLFGSVEYIRPLITIRFIHLMCREKEPERMVRCRLATFSISLSFLARFLVFFFSFLFSILFSYATETRGV